MDARRPYTKRIARHGARLRHWVSQASRTWVVVCVFVADAVMQIVRGNAFVLDPSLAALVAVALGFKTYKETRPIQPTQETGQIG
jgi:hypothetical protein